MLKMRVLDSAGRDQYGPWRAMSSSWMQREMVTSGFWLLANVFIPE